MNALRRQVSLLALCITLAAPLAWAGWQPGGVRLSAHTPNPEYLTMIGILPDGGQGAIVSWIWNYSPNMDRTDHRFMVQRVDALGNVPAPWPANGVAARTWFDDWGARTMYPIPAISDGALGVYCPTYYEITYSGEIRKLLDLFRVDPNAAVTGVPNFSVPNIDFYRMVVTVRLVADGSSGVIYANNTGNYLIAKRVSSQGNDLWGQYLPDVPVLAHPAGSIGEFDVLPDGAGGAYFAWWEALSAGPRTVRVQHLNANGAVAPGWPAQGTVVRNLAAGLDRLVLAPNGAGGVFVVWVDKRAGGSLTDLYAHNVLADGSLAPGVPTDGRMIPSPQSVDQFDAVLSDEQGGLFVTRKSWDGAPGSATNHQVRLHRLDSSLLPRPGWLMEGMLLTTTWWSYEDVALAPDGNGGAFIAFDSAEGAVYPIGLIGQHLAADGSPAPGWTSDGYLLSPSGAAPGIVRSGPGAIVVWIENDYYSGGKGGLYAQRLLPDGPVAVQISLVGADASPGEASLHWYAVGASTLSATVERRSDDSDWTALGTSSADGQGHMRYVDRSVGSGRFGYRLSWSEDGAAHQGGEVWVDVPEPWKLSLAPRHANPGTGPLSFSVTIPSRGGAAIELLDLQGRRVAHRDLGSLDAGMHRVTLDEGARLAPGVYLARLSHGGESRIARITRIR